MSITESGSPVETVAHSSFLFIICVTFDTDVMGLNTDKSDFIFLICIWTEIDIFGLN